MTIKKLQRYFLSADFDEVPTESDQLCTSGVYCLTEDVTELEATNEELVKALEDLLEELTHLGFNSKAINALTLNANEALKSARGE